MLIPISWLRDYVAFDLDVPTLAERLTMAGLEVEEIREVEGEPVLDMYVTPNRGDALSLVGVAREIAERVRLRELRALVAVRADRERLHVEVRGVAAGARFVRRKADLLLRARAVGARHLRVAVLAAHDLAAHLRRVHVDVVVERRRRDDAPRPVDN